MKAHGTRLHLIWAAVMVSSMLLAFAPDAWTIPVFARRYSQSCSFCHAPFPRLAETGARLASNGFRLSPGEIPPDAMSGGDDLLILPKSVPLAIRVDGLFRAYADKSDTQTDFESPWVMKVLSSAPLGKKLSYYFYFLMNERGIVAGAEDAFLVWNDLAGKPLDIVVGQFQVSDPLFKRELRLPVDDYMVYRVRVGGQTADLAYERGLMLVAEPAGNRITLEVLNGNGLVEGGQAARYDDDAWKNVFGHATRQLWPALRLGVLGYYGRQSVTGGTQNRLWMAGGDATVSRGPLEINLQYVHREDENPTFTANEARDVMDGGFVEALLIPEGSRWYGYALYNHVEDNLGLLDFGEGAPSGVRLYESVTVGAGYLVARNARVYGEVLYDTQQELSRLTLGLTAAY